MKISTKGRYGLRALVDLGYHSAEQNCVSLIQIARRQHISLNYLEQVFSTLRKAGIVKSAKGAQGGYALADAPEHISAGQVLKVLEGEFDIVEHDRSDAGEIQQVIERMVWQPVNERARAFLYAKTLKDLIDEYSRLNGSGTMMYYI